jgi:hypothetical protein
MTIDHADSSMLTKCTVYFGTKRNKPYARNVDYMFLLFELGRMFCEIYSSSSFIVFFAQSLPFAMEISSLETSTKNCQKALMDAVCFLSSSVFFFFFVMG